MGKEHSYYKLTCKKCGKEGVNDEWSDDWGGSGNNVRGFNSHDSDSTSIIQGRSSGHDSHPYCECGGEIVSGGRINSDGSEWECTSSYEKIEVKDGKLWLKVPFNEKQLAKDAMGHWDNDKKMWAFYVWFADKIEDAIPAELQVYKKSMIFELSGTSSYIYIDAYHKESGVKYV